MRVLRMMDKTYGVYFGGDVFAKIDCCDGTTLYWKPLNCTLCISELKWSCYQKTVF